MARKVNTTAIAVEPKRQYPDGGGLFAEISGMIDAAKRRAAAHVNAELTMLYWNVGKRINEEVLHGGKAQYGKQIVVELAERLTAAFGDGWKLRQLFYCMRLAEVYPDPKILHTLCAKLAWSHIRLLISIEEPLKREFYIEMCKIERWSVRELQGRINSMMFERTAIASKPEAVIRHDLAELKDKGRMSADLAFRDPYVLDFLGLRGEFAEKDLEKALVSEMRKFILEFGRDMAFVAEQKRISVDNEDYYLDLLFFHRRLRRLVAIELKIDSFKAEYKGQMELYLRWLDRHEKQKGENKPIGLILCAGKNEEHVELLELARSNIRVATYLTELPPKKVLEEKLHLALESARARLAYREEAEQ